MRIIGGNKRGLRLSAVGKGDLTAHLRPTTDRVRENIFNLLLGRRYGDPVTKTRVLDLFCGTGALGLEALSRGAEYATFIDDGPKAISLVKQNIGLCDVADKAQVLRRNATRLGQWHERPFDLVFLDPPYGKGLGEKALIAAQKGRWLAECAYIIWEEGGAPHIPAGFVQHDQRRYGDSVLTVLEKKTGA